MTTSLSNSPRARRLVTLAFAACILGVALDLRLAGVFRGIHADYTFHPDEPKQIHALANYLQGSYLWYTHSWFYDGYPYGLNHLDEWLLRGIGTVNGALRAHVLPEDAPTPGVIDRIELYYWARTLRVLYGMITLAATAAIAGLLARRRREIAWAAALAATAPLSIAVTHFATGDVGVDLFGTLALLALARHASRPRLHTLASAGVLVGLAFSCKYNGALTGIALALYVSLRATATRRWRSACAECGAVAGGAMAGVLAGTPALCIRWEQTWRDIFTNFQKIRLYCAPRDWAERPLLLRLRDSVCDSGPRIGEALGWMILAGALIALLLLVRRGWRPADAAADAGGNPAAARLAITAYPLIALTVSILGKPVVQPFHFSYLVPPLILGTVWAAAALRESGHAFARLLGLSLLVAALAASGRQALAERRLWALEDVDAFAHYANVIARADPSLSRRRGELIRAFTFEGPNVSEFRNLPGGVTLHDGATWCALPSTPLPTVPFPQDTDWILLNGPVFPRDDRTFHVMPGRVARRTAVAHGPAPNLRVGIRSGTWPAHVRLTVGGEPVTVRLGPHEERVVPLPQPRWRRLRGSTPVPDIRHGDIRAQTSIGDAWITLLRSDEEQQAYSLFGPHAADLQPPAAAWPAPDSPAATVLARARFHGPAQMRTQLLAATNALILHPERDWEPPPPGVDLVRTPLRTLGASCLPLPAGAYRLECDLVTWAPDAEVILDVADRVGLATVSPADRRERLDAPGAHTVTLAFTKTYAPFQCRATLTCTRGQVVLLAWRLVPDVPRILADLQAWRQGAAVPAWFTSPPSPTSPDAQTLAPDARFERGIRLREITFPPSARAGAGLRLRADVQLERENIPAFGDYSVFVHLYDLHGNLACAPYETLGDLIDASSGPGLDVPLPPALAPGVYELRVGLFNHVTQRQLALRRGVAPPARARGRELVLDSITILAHTNARAASPR